MDHSCNRKKGFEIAFFNDRLLAKIIIISVIYIQKSNKGKLKSNAILFNRIDNFV